MLRERGGGGCQKYVSQRARFLMSTKNRAKDPNQVKFWFRKLPVPLSDLVKVTNKILGLLQLSADPCKSHQMTLSGCQNSAA